MRPITGGAFKELTGVSVPPTAPSIALSEYGFDFKDLVFNPDDCGTWIVDVLVVYADGSISFPNSDFSFVRILEAV
jgi:hypothetical protein